MTSLIALFWNFPLIICNFPLSLSHSKNIRMSALITIIVINYWLFIIILMIITKRHNNYCSVGVMELCLLNLLILILIVFLYNSYPCLLFESLSHVINEESHVYSWYLGKIYLAHFLKFWNLPRFTREISKFQKSELGKLIPNLPLKNVITSTNLEKLQKIILKKSLFIVDILHSS